MYKSSSLFHLVASLSLVTWVGISGLGVAQQRSDRRQGDVFSSGGPCREQYPYDCRCPVRQKGTLVVENQRNRGRVQFLQANLDRAGRTLQRRLSLAKNQQERRLAQKTYDQEVKTWTDALMQEELFHNCRLSGIEKGCPSGWERDCAPPPPGRDNGNGRLPPPPGRDNGPLPPPTGRQEGFCQPPARRVVNICTLRQLAELVQQRYDKDTPIGIVKVINGNNPNGTYLMLLSGVEILKVFQATSIADAFFEKFTDIASNYRKAILDALSRHPVPPQAELILAGHSLGGMVAQNLVADPQFKNLNLYASRVISFGSPVTKRQGEPKTRYVHVEALLDIVPELTPPALGEDDRVRIGCGSLLCLNVFANHFVYKDSEDLNGYDSLGDEYGSKCLKLDCQSFKAYEAPGLRNLFDNQSLASSARHLALGNPSNATHDPNNKGNYLLLKLQYILSYDDQEGGPNWVSWSLRASDLGNAPRKDRFHPEAALPVSFKRVRPRDYAGSGYDRGHLCPSADRTSTAEDNDVTFSMANMLPQAPDLNRYLWKTLEAYCRRLVAEGNDLYLISGGRGSLDVIGEDNEVSVPTHIWKIVVVVPQGSEVSRINSNTRVIAVDVPNSFGVKGNAWQKYITTVDEVERATGYNFLSNVPEAIQVVIESRRDRGID